METPVSRLRAAARFEGRLEELAHLRAVVEGMLNSKPRPWDEQCTVLEAVVEEVDQRAAAVAREVGSIVRELMEDIRREGEGCEGRS